MKEIRPSVRGPPDNKLTASKPTLEAYYIASPLPYEDILWVNSLTAGSHYFGG
jgi:hypothetical protein